jgi:GntR family transcriptional regulator, transcriptional repressor for pyruvate dehydrogenase complex
MKPMERSQVRDDENLPVQRIAPAYRQVADQLRALVLKGELAPGQRLPNETELSTMFGVSRSTIREALRVLSSHNLITTSRGVGGGSFVARPAPDHISDYLETSLGLLTGSDEADTIGLSDLLEAREILEVPAARLAAGRRTEDQLEQLQTCLGNEQKMVEADERRYEEHRQFHELVVESAGNSLLAIVTRPVFSVVQSRFRRDAAPKRFWADVVDAHERILRCIAAGDEDGAAREMFDHLEELRDTYERIDRGTRKSTQ